MRSTRSVWIVVLAGTIGAAAPTSAAERARVLDKESFMEMEGIASPAISPDAKQIVFAREWSRSSQGSVPHQSLVYDPSTDRLRELTRGAWRDTAPVWSPDSKKLAFLSDRDGTNQIHTMFVDTGDVAQLTHLPRAASLAGLEMVAGQQDDRVLADAAGRRSDPEGRAPEAPARRRMGQGTDVVDRLSWARRFRSGRKGLHAPLRHRRAGRRHAAAAHRRQVQSCRAGMGGRWQDNLFHRPAQTRRGIPAR